MQILKSIIILNNFKALIIDFFNTSAKLKKIPRQGWIDKLLINDPESVAEHTFSMAVIGMIFADLEGYNTEKILKIILLHDIAEAVIGDITPEKMPIQRKTKLENNAMKKILSNLPKKLQKQYNELWIEYQLNHSKEAQLVHQIDKLEMALQAKTYSNEGHSEKSLASFFKTAENEIRDPKLIEIFKKIVSK
ncbi:HD domain-containing protein [Nitrosarchaeum sp.]|uniref:HD domain-containing protein n=1 Tax=Nitrosarchaeum sp. TaxID=2026886 RepID=UPI002620D0B0|nr:HD domain-containing protein [Nitrosarchaeum sp.]